MERQLLCPQQAPSPVAVDLAMQLADAQSTPAPHRYAAGDRRNGGLQLATDSLIDFVLLSKLRMAEAVGITCGA